MGKLYEKAGGEVITVLDEVFEQLHPDLVRHEVSVGVLMVSDEEDRSAHVLKHQGYPAAAVVKITPLEKRALGQPDAVIVIDAASWAELSDPQRRAVIDHELHHLVVVTDEHGRLKEDSCGRPRLRIRLHDLVVGGFEAIIRRHGKHALETLHIAQVNERLHQATFDFAAESPATRGFSERIEADPIKAAREISREADDEADAAVGRRRFAVAN